LEIIQNVINYALGLLAVIALVYLLYHGFLIATAGNDDSKAKKGKG
jgi:threonine/homoserine/homoserine lactone efflux protein